MRILVFSAYYEPEVAASLYLATNLYEDMAKHGWYVDVFVPLPTRGIDKETRNSYKNKKIEILVDGKLRIHRFWMFSESKKTILRIIRYLIINLVFIFRGLSTSADVIFVQSTPPTQGIVAAVVKRVKKTPFVYNLQDIFPDSMVNAGITKKNSIVWKIGRLIENLSYNCSDRIICISEDFRKNIYEKGVDRNKIDVVYNWVDENEVISIDREKNDLFDKYQLDKDAFYITHCGNIGLSQNMDLLLDVAEDIKQYSQIRFLLIGDGAYKFEVERQVIIRGLKNFIILPFQPYKDISKVFSLGDVGLVISKENIGQNSVPSKTWSYMSAEKPVIASFDTNSRLANIIHESGCGVCVEAGNRSELVNAIMEAYNNQKMRKDMGVHGRDFVLRNLTRKNGTSKYIGIIQAIIDNPMNIRTN